MLHAVNALISEYKRTESSDDKNKQLGKLFEVFIPVIISLYVNTLDSD